MLLRKTKTQMNDLLRPKKHAVTLLASVRGWRAEIADLQEDLGTAVAEINRLRLLLAIEEDREQVILAAIDETGRLKLIQAATDLIGAAMAPSLGGHRLE